MDAVILAAGRNHRLRGYVPESLKPLILVDGVPIIVKQLQAMSTQVRGKITGDMFPAITRAVVVVSPKNVEAIVDVVEANVASIAVNVFYVVQPSATGPVEALRLGLRALHGDVLTMVTCADNIIPDEHIVTMSQDHLDIGHDTLVVSTRTLPPEEASRFTAFHAGGVYDKQPIPAVLDGMGVSAWIGPIISHRSELWAKSVHSDNFGKLFSQYKLIVQVQGDCRDIGVPEALP